MAKKLSFFDRLTGASFDNDFDSFEEEEGDRALQAPENRVAAPVEEPGAAQLTVDVYQTPTEIIIRALVAGVKPEDLDIAITRDMVTVKGKRIEQVEGADSNFVYQELYWGAFERTIVLPAEVDVDAAEASEKHGLLVIKLPKINKDRQTRLRVRGT